VDDEECLSPELKEFIDRLIAPLLVERLLADTEGLYGESSPYYEGTRAA
jgi:hypothetical protein